MVEKKMYKHVNKGYGRIGIKDSKGEHYSLGPGDEVTIDMKREGNGVVVVNDKKVKGDDK